MKNFILTSVFLFVGIVSISADKMDACTANATWNGGNYSVTAPDCGAAMAGLRAALCADGWVDPNGC